MAKLLIGVLLGMLFLFLFLYMGGPTYLEAFGKKAEETGKSLKRYEHTTRDSAKKVGEKLGEVKNKFSSPDDKTR